MILLSKISGYLEGFGLFWFLLGEHLCLLKNIFSFGTHFLCHVYRHLLGNMWIFGEHDEKQGGNCRHPFRSPVYVLCYSMIISAYVQICLPCILAVLMVPLLCFCLPCVLQFIRRIRPLEEGKGASPESIQKLPIRLYRELSGEKGVSADSIEPSCPICLTDFKPEDGLRVLPCEHYFHKECVDGWLAVNKTCPSCRGGIDSSSAQARTPPSLDPHSMESRGVEMTPMSMA